MFATKRGTFVASVLAGTLAWALSWFMYVSPGLLYSQTNRFSDFCAQCLHPFERNLQEPILAFRMTVPFFAWLFGMSGVQALCIQYCAAIAALSCVCLSIIRRIHNPEIAILTTLAVSFTFVVQWSNNYLGFFDSVTHLCIALGLLTPSPFFAAILTLCGMMNDERFVLAIPFLVLWHGQLSNIGLLIRTTWPICLGFLAGVAAVSLCRMAIGHGWIGPGVQLPGVYAQIWKDVVLRLHPWDSSWPKFLTNVFMSFRWLWIFPLLVLTKHKELGKGVRLILAVSLFAAVLSTMMVADVSKSIAFIYPAFLLAIAYCASLNKESTLRQLKLVVILLLLTPTIYHVGYWSASFRPAPFEVIRYYVLHGRSFSSP